ncbi:unnamed protein product [Caenorhabditis angaria]|uniref:Uncharacterized protein n=1 Tax=Caenorhabditis angaria TaxID=860376 RepID=A0A9P1IMM1_9PELO|nr:unnamed protein product [Caenorhabditis angaria]
MLKTFLFFLYFCGSVQSTVVTLKSLATTSLNISTSQWIYLIKNSDSVDDYKKVSGTSGTDAITLDNLIESYPITFDGEINVKTFSAKLTTTTPCTTCETLTGLVYYTDPPNEGEPVVKKYIIAPTWTENQYNSNADAMFAFFPYANTSQFFVKFEDFKYPLYSTIQFYLDDKFTQLAFDVTEKSTNISSPNPTLIFPLSQIFIKTTGPGVYFNASLISEIPVNLTASAGSFIMTNMYPNEIETSQNFTVPILSGDYLDIELTLQRDDDTENANNTVIINTKRTDLSFDQNSKIRISLDPLETQFYVQTPRPMYMKYTIGNFTQEEGSTTTTTTVAPNNGSSTTTTTVLPTTSTVEVTTKIAGKIEGIISSFMIILIMIL